MSSADLITCLCKACGNLLCVSTNDWTEVTTSYATYDVVALFSHPGLEQTGPQRPGSRDSELGGCTVQPLQCTKCKESMGVKCTSVAPEKEMHRDRCFLKLGKLNMKNLTGVGVDPRIKVKGAPRPDANSSVTVDHMTGKDLNASHTSEGHNSTLHSPAMVNGTALQAQNDSQQLVKRQESDIIVILQTLETLQKEMKGFQKEMKAVKVAVNDTKVRQDEQQIPELFEDIELLTETVANVSSKVGELDALKLESKMIQSRLKRVEDEKRGLQTGMDTPPTPRLQSNSARPSQSLQPAEEKAVAKAIYSPRRNPHLPAVDSPLGRSRAASVQASHSAQTHSHKEMPPPKLPRSASGRALVRSSPARSVSESGHVTRGRSNLHNTTSIQDGNTAENPGAENLPAENPPAADDDDEDDDEEYNAEESSPDPEDEIFQPGSIRSRQSLPARMASNDMGLEGHYDTKSNKRRRTTSHALNRDGNTPPSPHPDDPNYQSIWADPTAEPDRGTPPPSQRNEHGFIIKANGQVDKRSLRFLGKVKKKRRSVGKHAPRDTQGYLLDPDGTRNERSVRIINGMRKRELEEDGEEEEEEEEEERLES